MNDKEIRKWYQDNGMEYIPEDWGRTLETGESATVERRRPQRIGRLELWRFTATDSSLDELPMHGLIGVAGPRTPEESRGIEAMEAFFAPYIAMLPRAKGELIRELVNDRKTYTQIAEDDRFYNKGHAQREMQRAIRALVRSIAQDDPDFELSWPRDHEAEQAAAERVFDRYWEEVTR